MTCIKGRGFDNQTGGFSVIMVDDKEVPKSVIAAAPDLLAALEDMVACVTPLRKEAARAAIAKAHGE